MTPEEFDAAFLRNIVPVPFSGCHLWAGSSTRSGYGVMGGAYTHRYAWERENGAIGAGLCVLHKCDVPSCVNPMHLFLGTVQDNNQDKCNKGRARGGSMKGEAHPSAKLNAQKVRDIRAKYAAGQRQTSLAREFGMSQPTISQIVRRELWDEV